MLITLLTLLVAGSAPPPTSSATTRTLFVAVDGSSQSGCTQSSPCNSFDVAYRKARPGDSVVVAGGTYPEQVVGVDSSKLRVTRDVVFRPAPGAAVVVNGDLTVKGSHAVFEGEKRRDGSYSFSARRVLSEIDSSLATASTNVTFRNLKANMFTVTGTRSIRFEGGDYGPSVACWPRGTTGSGPLGGEITPAMWCPVGSGYEESGNTSGTEPRIGPSGTIERSWPRNIVLDGVTIHDQNSLDFVNLHSGGLFIVSVRGLRIENSLFYGNIVYDIFAQDFTTPDCCRMNYGPATNVVIINNRFKAPVNAALQDGGNGWTSRVKNSLPEIQLDPRNGRPWADWRIERNSFDNGILFSGHPTFRNVSVRRNVGGGGSCYPKSEGLEWVDNAMKSDCNSFRLPFGYIQRGGALRPAPGSADTVRMIFSAAAKKSDVAAVARLLERRNRAGASGRWTAADVRRIIRDRSYLGGAIGPAGAHPRLVSNADWLRAQRAAR